MAIQRVVVEIDLGVEAEELAVLGDDQRIDLEQAHVLLDEGLVELGAAAALICLLQIGVEAERLRRRCARDAGMMPVAGSTEMVDDLFGRVVRDLLDVHAAFGRDDEGDARGARDRPASRDRTPWRSPSRPRCRGG